MQNLNTKFAQKNECAEKLDEVIELIMVMKECMDDDAEILEKLPGIFTAPASIATFACREMSGVSLASA